MVAFTGRKTWLKHNFQRSIVLYRGLFRYNYKRRLQVDKVASQLTKPGFFPRSKLPNM